MGNNITSIQGNTNPGLARIEEVELEIVDDNISELSEDYLDVFVRLQPDFDAAAEGNAGVGPTMPVHPSDGLLDTLRNPRLPPQVPAVPNTQAPALEAIVELMNGNAPAVPAVPPVPPIPPTQLPEEIENTPPTVNGLEEHLGNIFNGNGLPNGEVEEITKRILEKVSASYKLLSEAEEIEKLKSAKTTCQKIFYERALRQPDQFYDWGRSKVVVIGNKHCNKTRDLINSLLGKRVQDGKTSENTFADLTLHRNVLTYREQQSCPSPWVRNLKYIETQLPLLGGGKYPLLSTFAMYYASKETLRMSEEETRKLVLNPLPNKNANTMPSSLSGPSQADKQTAKLPKSSMLVDLPDFSSSFNQTLAQNGMIHEFTVSLLEFQSKTSSQCLFHDLIFISHGVYIIVCDVDKILGTDTEMKKEMNSLRDWISSIQFFAPESHFLIVAAIDAKLISYSEQAGISTEDELVALINILIQDNLDLSAYQNFVANEKEKLCFFMNLGYPRKNEAIQPVDHADWTPPHIVELKNMFKSVREKDIITTVKRKHIYTLQEAVESVIRKQNTMYPRLVSPRWVFFIEYIFKEHSQSPKVSLNTVKEIARGKFGIYSSDEIHRILSLLHELGLLFYLPTTEVLRETVILQPPWLLKSLNKIFIFKEAFDKNEHFQGKITGLEVDADMLVERGLASFDLLEYIWGKEDTYFLVDAMLEMMHMSPWGFGCEKNIFLIPSLLQDSEPPVDTSIVASEKGRRLIIDFLGTPVPTSLFHRLVCLFVDYSRNLPCSADPNLSRYAASVWFGKVPIHIWHHEPQRDVIYIHIGESTKKQKGASIQSCISSIHTMARKVVEGSYLRRTGTLKWKLKFEYNVGESFKFLDLKDAKAFMKKNNTWFPKKRQSKRIESGSVHLTYDQITDFANLI